MKTFKTLLTTCIIAASALSLQAQKKTYLTSGGEVIFSGSQLELNDEYRANNQVGIYGPGVVSNPVRFTAFLHIGQFLNIDFSNNLGVYTGIGLRNVGIISNETLPSGLSLTGFQDYKIIRRVYSASIPFAFKVGSFKDHYYLYAGGEIDWAFHYKEKYWKSHSRSGTKYKNSQWFPKQVETFQPSVFLGFQFPKGINLKAKYYLNDFLNHNYIRNTTAIDDATVSNLSKYSKSKVFYVALSWNFKTNKNVIPNKEKDEEVAFNL